MKIKQSLVGVGLGIAALLLSACGGNSNPLGEASSSQPAQSGSASASAAGAPVVVGSADFTESQDPGRDLFASDEGEGGRIIDQARHWISRDIHQGLARWVDLGRT
jgi:hypothetical protein